MQTQFIAFRQRSLLIFQRAIFLICSLLSLPYAHPSIALSIYLSTETRPEAERGSGSAESEGLQGSICCSFSRLLNYQCEQWAEAGRVLLRAWWISVMDIRLGQPRWLTTPLELTALRVAMLYLCVSTVCVCMCVELLPSA